MPVNIYVSIYHLERETVCVCVCVCVYMYISVCRDVTKEPYVGKLKFEF